MNQLSAVMALKVRGRHYADNIGRCDILFASFRHFKLQSLFSEVLIVIPGAEESYIREYAQAWNDFPVRFIVEDEYLEKFKVFSRVHEVRAWHRQQIIKLFCAGLVKSDFFMVLDPDVFAVKPFAYSDVIVDQRAIVETDRREWHKDWWLSSADLLGVEPNLDRIGIGVTPAILSSAACRELCAYITERHGKLWYEVLLSRYMTQWTEYTLYQLFLEHSGQFDKYHVNPAEAGLERRLHSPAPWGVWHAGDYEKLNWAELFSGKNPGLLTVVQSNVGVTPQTIVADLARYMPVPIQSYTRSSSKAERVQEVYGAVVRRLMQALQTHAPAPVKALYRVSLQKLLERRP